MRGRCASSRNVGAGCDGRLPRRVIFTRRNAAAYGEIAGAWRRDRGVHPIPCRSGNGNGDNQRRSPGRLRISRKAIARGKPGCPGCTCGSSRVHLCSTPTAHGTAGAVGARLSLRPRSRRGPTTGQPGRKSRRGNEGSCPGYRFSDPRPVRGRHAQGRYAPA